jgi:hypothetical protein
MRRAGRKGPGDSPGPLKLEAGVRCEAGKTNARRVQEVLVLVFEARGTALGPV